ncbi:MAG: hypothetical protein DHS20C05_19840 [Hyphococcus sp.]|nr:MAG: hypothetical protein DHS20C05_19840 [Marinicaulis sp.]
MWQLTLSFLAAWTGGFLAGMFGWGLPMLVGMHYNMPQCDMDKIVIGKIATVSCLEETADDE